MFYYLAQHPDLKLSFWKEIHYYNFYLRSGRSLNWYRSFFPLKISSIGKKTGEASPNYLYSETAPLELKRDIPRVKLIVLLRNPIDRAYSEYSMHVRKDKRRDPPSFEQSIANEKPALRYSSQYLSRGQYASRILNWLKHFDREQFIFIRSEDFFADPKPVLEKVYRFLQIEEVYPDDLKAQEPGSYSELSAETRARLEVYYQESNRMMVDLLGEEFRW